MGPGQALDLPPGGRRSAGGRGPFRGVRAGHDVSAVGGVGGEHAMVASQAAAGRRHQGGEFLDELTRREHHVGGAVVARRLQGQGEALRIEPLQAAVGQGRTVGVATETFEPVAVVGRDRGGGVQGEAAGANAQGAAADAFGRIAEE